MAQSVDDRHGGEDQRSRHSTERKARRSSQDLAEGERERGFGREKRAEGVREDWEGEESRGRERRRKPGMSGFQDICEGQICTFLQCISWLQTCSFPKASPVSIDSRPTCSSTEQLNSLFKMSLTWPKPTVEPDLGRTRKRQV